MHADYVNIFKCLYNTNIFKLGKIRNFCFLNNDSNGSLDSRTVVHLKSQVYLKNCFLFWEYGTFCFLKLNSILKLLLWNDSESRWCWFFLCPDQKKIFFKATLYQFSKPFLKLFSIVKSLSQMFFILEKELEMAEPGSRGDLLRC